MKSIFVVASLAVLFSARSADAHKPSDAHVRVSIDRAIQGDVEVALRDLDAALAIDADGDGRIRWQELNDANPQIEQYLSERLRFSSSGRDCQLQLGDSGLVDLSDGAYWSESFRVRCPGDHDVSLSYRLLFDIDAQHRGLIHVEGAKAKTVIARDDSAIRLDAPNETSIREFIVEGIWHIWSGIDHLLFLTALILPAVWAPRRRRGTAGAPRESLREIGIEVFEIVTAFTLAHSITLVMSAIGLVRFPSRFVETAIALSVVAAALNNVTRAIDTRWAIALALGLLHGFGFSSVLIDSGLPSHELVGALLGFNLGVEIGQAAFVVALLPFLFLIRRSLAYRLLLYGGSAVIAIVASVWAYQRCFP